MEICLLRRLRRPRRRLLPRRASSRRRSAPCSPTSRRRRGRPSRASRLGFPALARRRRARRSRRNLRQALYNLRQSLPELDEALARRATRTVALHLRGRSTASTSIEFLDASLRRGLPGATTVLVSRRCAAPPGSTAATCSPASTSATAAAFEDWLGRQQEPAPRGGAAQALGALVEHFAARGDYHEAISHGRRLVEIDPLSEEAHRELMRLYVLVGRRRRALAQYDDLATVLRRELGVDPLAETRALHQSVLSEERPPADRTLPARPAPLGPFVPLAGRGEEMAQLERSFRAAASGARLALVEGPPGIGRSRLAKTFLDRVSSRRQARVAHARCLDQAAAVAGRPFVELLATLATLDGEAEPVAAAVPVADAAGGCGAGGEQLAAAVLTGLAEQPARPLALFLDDFHWADDEAWGTLAGLLDRAADLPLWLVVAVDEAAPAASGPGERLAAHPRVDRVRPARLDGDDLEEIAATLVGSTDDAARLAAFLAATCQGLPLAVVEHVDALCDEGVLVAAGDRRWSLERDPAGSPTAGLSLEELISHRIRRLPPSARRLMVLAAVIGPTFDVELLQRASHEQMAVVEISLELMLERRLVRQVAHRWSPTPRDRDLVRWAQGARRGELEISHPLVRRAAIAELPAARRRRLHLDVAEALAARTGDGIETPPEVMRHHLAEAGEAPSDQKKKRTPR
jgi:tetratricopeptide (TPR) repeat protein